MERDVNNLIAEKIHSISTHTLTWSVTPAQARYTAYLCVFQLTRSRGAWLCRHYVPKRFDNFNSHAHVERDCFCIINKTVRLVKFQLTRSRGAWLLNILENSASTQFQLTRSRGAWPPDVQSKFYDSNFNSHAHVERDAGGELHMTKPKHFNSHAHVERDNCAHI